jgi:hypothetical protein
MVSDGVTANTASMNPAPSPAVCTLALFYPVKKDKVRTNEAAGRTDASLPFCASAAAQPTVTSTCTSLSASMLLKVS